MAWVDEDYHELVVAGGYDGGFSRSVYHFPLLGALTGVDESSPSAPLVSQLLQNRPNPFNPRTEIVFDLARDGLTRLAVFDAHGRMVRLLVDQALNRGRHEAQWDGLDQSGRAAASGVYFYRLETRGTRDTRRMVLLR
jgi:hypothetical protein